MNQMKIYVVQLPECGWDNVIGIFDASQVTQEELEVRFPEGEYVVTDSHLATLDNFGF